MLSPYRWTWRALAVTASSSMAGMNRGGMNAPAACRPSLMMKLYVASAASTGSISTVHPYWRAAANTTLSNCCRCSCGFRRLSSRRFRCGASPMPSTMTEGGGSRWNSIDSESTVTSRSFSTRQAIIELAKHTTGPSTTNPLFNRNPYWL
ncbi:hypothetical protein FWK35_00011287 [Aphis craccivora]|uniref:Uncharacterized protein n=1 Tax=Aphis craccivora TaxID=307492 RepID=A0A6G0YTY8_APHCR|nr:hypothetical protein FWK35_00011287 [Aphis craccivora]